MQNVFVKDAKRGPERIEAAFKNGKAFIPFITCGYPNKQATMLAVKTAQENGADLIELGIPFSDPTAEGPVIQEANLKALQGGIHTDEIFEMVKELRTKSGIVVPMVFMTYANVVFSYGIERFMQKAAEVGMDGIILPDVPFEEKNEFDKVAKQYDIAMISLIAPTSNNRIAKIAKEASGFIYIVSSLGVTGVRSDIKTDIGSIVKVIRENSKVPCAVGFGISTPEQAQKMSSLSDGAIVGSAIIKRLATLENEPNLEAKEPEVIGTYVSEMKSAIKAL